MNRQMDGAGTESALPHAKPISCLPLAGRYSVGKNRLSKGQTLGCGAEGGWRSQQERGRCATDTARRHDF